MIGICCLIRFLPKRTVGIRTVRGMHRRKVELGRKNNCHVVRAVEILLFLFPIAFPVRIWYVVDIGKGGKIVKINNECIRDILFMIEKKLYFRCYGQDPASERGLAEPSAFRGISCAVHRCDPLFRLG